MKHPWTQPKLSLVAVFIMAWIGCAPEPPTTNPVKTLDVEQFHQMITAKEFDGLVAVFASWCPPCIEELPELAALYRKERPKNARIIAVGMDKDGVEKVQRLVNKLDLPFPVYYVGEPLAGKYEIIGVPTLMVVRQGHIVEKIPGQISSRKLAAKLKLFHPAEP